MVVVTAQKRAAFGGQFDCFGQREPRPDAAHAIVSTIHSRRRKALADRRE